MIKFTYLNMRKLYSLVRSIYLLYQRNFFPSYVNLNKQFLASFLIDTLPAIELYFPYELVFKLSKTNESLESLNTSIFNTVPLFHTTT